MPAVTRPFRSATALLLAAGLLATPAPGKSESSLAGQTRHPSAGLDFRIVIPPVVRVLENSHPLRLAAEAGGDWSAEQRLVVVSNMKRGFCVTLRMSAPEVDAWRLRTAQSGGVTLSLVSEGYRVCTPHPGRYTLLLQHEFGATQKAARGELRWPVQTDISAI